MLFQSSFVITKLKLIILMLQTMEVLCNECHHSLSKIRCSFSTKFIIVQMIMTFSCDHHRKVVLFKHVCVQYPLLLFKYDILICLGLGSTTSRGNIFSLVFSFLIFLLYTEETRKCILDNSGSSLHPAHL